MSKVAMRLVVSGRVQGVGFRAWTQREALAGGLAGSAVNLPAGQVEVYAEGSRAGCAALLATLRGGRTPGAVAGVDVEWVPPSGAVGFRTG